MSTFGFPWFRLWVRPFVSNIDAIPEGERRYYEDFLLATFNNPARVDLNNDMMWNFLTVEQAAERKKQIDQSVLPALTEALQQAHRVLADQQNPGEAKRVFRDQHDRLVAYRCYCLTMRNTIAWTEAVHGYMGASTPEAKLAFRALCRDMVASERQNAQALLDLWEKSTVDFMPVSTVGESLHTYGENFGDLLRRKIALMERHADDEPYVDPGYMWRMW
jgi:hypothetical protein